MPTCYRQLWPTSGPSKIPFRKARAQRQRRQHGEDCPSLGRRHHRPVAPFRLSPSPQPGQVRPQPKPGARESRYVLDNLTCIELAADLPLDRPGVTLGCCGATRYLPSQAAPTPTPAKVPSSFQCSRTGPDGCHAAGGFTAVPCQGHMHFLTTAPDFRILDISASLPMNVGPALHWYPTHRVSHACAYTTGATRSGRQRFPR